MTIEHIDFDDPAPLLPVDQDEERIGEGIHGEDYELGEKLSHEELNEDELKEEYQWAN